LHTLKKFCRMWSLLKFFPCLFLFFRYCTSKGFFYSNFQDFIVGFEFQTWRAQVWTSNWIQQAGGQSRLFQLQVSWICSYMLYWKGSFGTYLCRTVATWQRFNIDNLTTFWHLLATLWWIAFDHYKLNSASLTFSH